MIIVLPSVLPLTWYIVWLFQLTNYSTTSKVEIIHPNTHAQMREEHHNFTFSSPASPLLPDLLCEWRAVKPHVQKEMSQGTVLFAPLFASLLSLGLRSWKPQQIKRRNVRLEREREKKIKERKPLRWKIEFYFPPTLPFCLPSIPQKSVLYPSRLSAHLCCILLQLKDWTRNDCLCPEISGPHSSVNSFGNQMLIHHISLTRI